MAGPEIPPRLLLVSDDPALTAQTKAAALSLGAQLEVMPGVDAAIAWLLTRENGCTHLLAPASLPAAEINALAAMVDEVTKRPAPLLLLGAAAGQGPNIRAVEPATTQAITDAVRGLRPFEPSPLPELTAAAMLDLMRDGTLHMRFQPILTADTLVPAGLEMLLRLHHPTLGILRPKDFLSHAAASGEERLLIGAAALRAVTELYGGLGALRGHRQGPISLNTPMLTFCRPEAVQRLTMLCAATGMEHHQLVLELLETPALPNLTEVAAALERWREAGFHVLLDDAGPPLPHWRQLIDLPFSGIKLDASLAADTPAARGESAEIAQAALRRNLFVVAEGIETEAALNRTRSLGIQAVQGFLFSRPLPTRAVPIWLNTWEAQHAQPV